MSLTAQKYYADEQSLKKEYRMFTLSDEMIGKITRIPNVIDNLESESATDALSANMGRVLKGMVDLKQDKLIAWDRIIIDNVTNTISADIGWVMVYQWNVADPSELPVSWQSQWDCWYSESDWHLYAWDWTQWQDIWWTGIDLSDYFNKNTDTSDQIIEWDLHKFVTIAEKNVWNSKQDRLIAWSNIQIDTNTNTISATDTKYTAWVWIAIDSNNVISSTVSSIAWWNIIWNINNQTDLISLLNRKQNALTAWENITIENDVISSKDTTYSAWDWISINEWIISNTDRFIPGNIWEEWQYLMRTPSWYGWADWGGGWWWGADVSNARYWITWSWNIHTAPSQDAVYDKISSMDIIINWKQNKLTAWENIEIINDVISAIDTKYTAEDFDIKDLADSTWLRTIWSNKQDKINDLETIRQWAAKWMTALQPWDNVSELVNDAGYLTKANWDTYYYTKNETYNKQEINNLIQNMGWYEVVSVLPTTDIKNNIIYLLWPKSGTTDVYEEYVYINNAWVKIWETTVDLTNYFNKVNDTSDNIIEWNTHLFMTIAERNKLASLQNETRITIMEKLWKADANNDWYLAKEDWRTFNWKQDRLEAWDNITINGNVISATWWGRTYHGWNWIRVSNDTITNTKPFDPDNDWNVNQVLTKTAGWYVWADSQWGWGGWWGGWNFNPAHPWSKWQVLTKLSWDTYDWQDSECNVRAWYFDSSSWAGLTQETMQQIVTFLMIDSDWNECAIIKDVSKKDNFIYNYYQRIGAAYKFRFVWTKRYTRENYESQKWNYTSWRSYILDIYVETVGWQLQYDWKITQNDDDLTVTNYLSCVWHKYRDPYLPTDPCDPATKAYVDAQVASGWSGMWITSNYNWTNIRVLQEWAWTEQQFNNIQHLNWVIYNIIG